MKTSMFLLLMSIFLESFGAIIIIKGQPVPLDCRNELYYLPANYIIKATSLYITMDGINKVCFLNAAPSGMFEQVSQINIASNGVKTVWNCFPYKTTVLEVRP
jgi:hypothetical protein